jgi:hypothetical protein
MGPHRTMRRGQGFRVGQPGKHALTKDNRRFQWRPRTLGALTAIALVFAVGGAGASARLIPNRSSSSHKHPESVSVTIKFNPATQAKLRKLESTSKGRAILLRAFQSSFGKTAEVASISVKDGSKFHLDATCAPSFSCGISRSGGWHFWIIAS